MTEKSGLEQAYEFQRSLEDQGHTVDSWYYNCEVQEQIEKTGILHALDHFAEKMFKLSAVVKGRRSPLSDSDIKFFAQVALEESEKIGDIAKKVLKLSDTEQKMEEFTS